MILPRRTLTSTKFAKRRRKILIWKVIGTIVVLAGLIVGFFALTRLATFSIRTITVKGNTVTSNADIDAIADSYLDQYVWHFIPRRDTFFLQESQIAGAIKSQWLRINSVTVTRDGLHGITITIDEKVPAYLWCGATQADFLATATTSCYLMDDTGYIFDEVPTPVILPVIARSVLTSTSASTSTNSTSSLSSVVSTTSAAVSSLPDLFKFYGDFDVSTSTSATSTAADALSTTPIATSTVSTGPLGERFASETEFASMNSFESAFIAQASAFGFAPVAILKTNEDESQVLMNNGLRIFISDEEDVPTTIRNISDFLASLSTLSGTSTKSSLTISGIEYIDARYDDKIYYMPK